MATQPFTANAWFRGFLPLSEGLQIVVSDCEQYHLRPHMTWPDI